ncbi:MAG: pyridoxal 4-dehydrogenase [Phycisphaeraceae bacterium]|nr:pyridoxal 4-dehydrogenase [Phycisphaeraceae bacterium]
MQPFASRRLGKTDLDLPALGFGAAPIGDLFVRVSERESTDILTEAWNAGVRYYDTSPFYGSGKSELRLGVLLREHPRDDFVLSSKVGRTMTAYRGDTADFEPGEFVGALPFDLKFDYSYDGVMRSYEDSTIRLGLNRIDLLIIHDLDHWFHVTDEAVEARLKELESGWKALTELKSAGLIHGIGAGINQKAMMMPFMERFDLDFFLVAIEYNLLTHDVLDREFPECERRGIGVITGAPFASGILATGPGPDAKFNYEPASEEVQQRVAGMQKVAARHDLPLTAAAMQFPFGHPIVASVIPGAVEKAHPGLNVAAMSHDVPGAFWQELKDEGLLRKDAPVPG